MGWRYVLSVSEEWIREEQDWPANLQKRERQEEQERKQKQEQDKENNDPHKVEQPMEEHEWKRQSRVEENAKHHDADDGKHRQQEGQKSGMSGQTEQESEFHKLLKKYSPQEIALLRSLQHEREYMKHIKQNDGKRKSTVTDDSPLLSIDEADQFSPDNWIPRSSNLLRLTGKHPLNAEPKLTPLFEAGLTTPNEYHYVRNHGYGSFTCGPQRSIC